MIDIPMELALIIVSIAGIVGTAKILSGSSRMQQSTHRKMMQLERSYVKQLEEQISYLESELKSSKSALARTNRVPSLIEGGIESLIPQLADHAPAWLRPILRNKEAIPAIQKVLESNPELVKKFIGGIKGKEDNTNNEQQLSL